MMPERLIIGRTGELVAFACKACGQVCSPKAYAVNGAPAWMAAWRHANECCMPRLCSCGQKCESPWAICKACKEKKHRRKLSGLERVEWDGECMVAHGDDFYENINYARDDDCAYVHPCRFREFQIDIGTVHNDAVDDHYDDAELSGSEWQAVIDAVKAFNAAPCGGSWDADESRVIVLDAEKFEEMIR